MLKTGVFVLAVAGSFSMTQGADLAVTYLGKLTASGDSTDQNADVFTPGEMSGISWSGTGGLYYVVGDSTDHVIQLNVATTALGAPVSVSYGPSLSVNQPGSDLEGIAYSSAKPNSVYVSNEATNSIYEYNRTTGALIQTIAPTLPSAPRANFSLESLSSTGNTLWTANEEALTNDGPLSTTGANNGTLVRLQKLNVSGGTAAEVAEYAYKTAPIHAAVSGDTSSLSRSGLSDIIALPDGRLIALERSFAVNGLASSYQSRLYEINIGSATDVSGLASLTGGGFSTVSKTELWSRTTNLFSGSNGIGNLEGIALGPRLADGSFVLVGVVDNAGGSDPLGGNSMVFFNLTGVPEPTTMAIIPGAATLLLRRRR